MAGMHSPWQAFSSPRCHTCARRFCTGVLQRLTTPAQAGACVTFLFASKDLCSDFRSEKILGWPSQVHGAGLANAIFLPRGAIVVDVMQKGFYARTSWSMRWVRDYKNLQLSYVPLAEQLSHLLPVSLESPEYQDLMPQERERVDQADCPRAELQEKCSWWWWYGSSVIVDGIQAEQAVWVAMHQIGRGTP